MVQTFTNLPFNISDEITKLLSREKKAGWLHRADKLHERYATRHGDYIKDFPDVLAYLGLRTPATYAQIFGALLQVQEVVPSWNPKSLLDIGSGPGVGVWAIKTLWPSLETADCIDREKHFLAVGKEIIQGSDLQVDVSFRQKDITHNNDSEAAYDLVLIANVLNELSLPQQKELVGRAYNQCKGIMVIIEPGTPLGIQIVQASAKDFSGKATLLAPYINNTFVESQEQWIHFSQRFVRPEFQRRIRQHMRESALMASDWEESKYAYAAIGKIPAEDKVWGRVMGTPRKQNGFLEIPILTQEGIAQVKVLKRHKKEYAFAKNLRWGESIKKRKNLL